MDDTLKLRCAHCGSDQFEFPTEPQADDHVTCIGCGRRARFGDLQAAALEQAKDLATKIAGKIFGK